VAGQIRAAFTHDDIRDVVATYNNGQPALSLRLTAEAGERLTRLTSQNVGGFMTITLDGRTVSEARVTAILGESLVIAGLEIDEIRLLAVILQAGALPEGVRTRVAPSKAP
jgi:preprotein translocase subunit SecD